MKPTQILLATIAGLSLPVAVFGQTPSTWDGSADGNWNTLANWLADTLPTNSNATFNNNVNPSITLANVVPIFQLRFDTSSTGNFTFGGSAFRASGSGANIRVEANITNGPTLTWNNNWQTTPDNRTSPGGFSVVTNAGSNATLVFNGNLTTSSAVAAPGLIQIIDFKLANAAASGGTTVNGIISNSATGTGLTSVVKTGSGQGTMTLNGANTYSGSTVWNTDSGSIVLGNKAALGTGIVRIAGTSTGTLSANIALTGANAIANPLSFNSSSLTPNAVNAIFTTVQGSNVITLTATGTTPAVGDLIFGTSTNAGASGGNGFIPYYSRVTAVSGTGAGALVTIDQAAIATGTTAAISVAKYTGSSAGTLNVAGTNALEFSGPQNLTSVYSNGTSSTRTFNITNTADTIFSGVLQQQGGTASVTKTGTGKLILTNANTYTGATVITTGTLQLGNGGTSGSLSTSSAITNNANLTINRSNAVTQGTDFSGAALGGSGSFTQAGPGTTTLNQVNTYVGATSVTGGTLIIDGSGSINTSSGVTVDGGTFKNNSSVALTAPLTFTSGTVSGTNLSGVALTVGAGQIVSPGNSPGTMSAGDVTFANGGSYLFEVNNAGGTAGANWDLLNATSLTLTATSGGFTVNLASLVDPTNAAGDASGFVPDVSHNFLFVDTDSAISSIAGVFTVNTAAFTNSLTGTWSITRGDTISGGDNTQLYVSYTAIPEPSTYAALAGLGVIGLSLFRRRRAGSKAAKPA